MKKKIINDEINFTEIIINIWANKLKLTLITLSTIILALLAFFNLKQNFTANTKIEPITIFEQNLYNSYNILIQQSEAQMPKEDREILKKKKLPTISKNYLLNLFLEELQTREIINEALQRFEIIDRKNFNDEIEYLKEIKKKGLEVEILSPINVDGSKRTESRRNWTIRFTVLNKEKWEEALEYINIAINKKIRNYLSNSFDLSIDNLKLIKKFELEDLDSEIDDVKKLYEITSSNRLAFLNEQAIIARELNIKNNTLETQNFNSESSVISSIQTKNPYYMRGYSMIEKEIELIKSRTDIDAFTSNLVDLEKQKRNLLDDPSLKRIEMLFSNTPIKTKKNFKAANIIYDNTQFRNRLTLKRLLLLATFIGLIFGLFYVYVSNAIQQRK